MDGEEGMTLDPLLGAPIVVQVHAVATIAAFALAVVQRAAPTGTGPHRGLGRVWVGLMAIVALSSFAIHTICSFGPVSPIHGLSIETLAVLPVAIVHARRQRGAPPPRDAPALCRGAADRRRRHARARPDHPRRGVRHDGQPWGMLAWLSRPQRVAILRHSPISRGKQQDRPPCRTIIITTTISTPIPATGA
jgi:uncharacterized membrane protein